MPDYNVYKKDGSWVGKRVDAARPSVRADTQADAYDAAKGLAARNGGGDVSIHGLNGQVRDKNTIKPGRDPRNSKG